MHKVQFSGRVFPEDYSVEIEGSPTLHTSNEFTGLTTIIKFKVTRNIISIDCECNTLDKGMLIQALQRAQTAIEAAVNLLTFATGVCHYVFVDKIHMPDGESITIIAEDRQLAKLSTSVTSGKAMYDALSICLSDVSLSLAVRDLCEAVKGRSVAEINFARAVDTIRQYFVPDGGRKEDGWKPMNSALNATQEFTSQITKLSRFSRHGNYYETDGKQLRPAAIGAWTLVNRYIEYRLRGDQPLPLSEFPLLE